MFILTYDPTDPDEYEEVGEEFDDEASARGRGCVVIAENVGTNVRIESEQGAVIVDAESLNSYCNGAPGGGGGGGTSYGRSPAGRRRIKVLVHVVGSGHGQWVIVRVNDSACGGSQGASMIQAMQLAFGKPVCLMGTRRTYGPPNLTNQLRNADPRRMSWDSYTVTL